MSELYRDFIDGKADEIINSLGGTITPAPANAELYRDFLDRKFDDVINGIDNVLPIGSASGNPVTFYTSVSKPLVACKTEFMCTQEAGTPSPSNPLAITGVDDITLTVNGNNVVIDLDGTRYGGYVDVVRKKLVVTDRINLIKNSGDRGYDTNQQAFRFTFDDIYIYPSIGIVPDVRSSIYKTVETRPWAQWINAPDFCISARATLKNIVIKDSRYTSMADYINDMGDLEIIYPLATPIEISLSDIPTLSTIIGNNSFASDSGNIDLKYRCLPIDLI